MEKETSNKENEIVNFVITKEEAESFKEDLVKDMRIKNDLKYKKNPFIVDEDGRFVLDVKTKNTKIYRGGGNEAIVNTDTGEITGQTTFIQTQKVDSNQFAKLFVNEIKNLLDLSQTTYKMLLYIMTLLKPNKDEIYIFVPDVMEHCNWKNKPTVYKAIKELIQNEIIAPSWKPNIYFINPSILFNGDKLILVKAYQKDDSYSQMASNIPAIMPGEGENQKKLKDLFNLMDNENGQL